MIGAFSRRLFAAGLLGSAAALAAAMPAVAQPQPSTQRGTGGAARPQQQEPQRGATPTAQQRPATTQARPAAATQAPPAAQTRPGAAAQRPGGGQPAAAAQAALLDSFGDWGAYAAGQGRSKICYALSTPKDRLPKELKRDPAYVFVSFRPAENVRNEVAVVMGFPTKDGGAAEAAVGPTRYMLVTKGSNAWIRNPAEEGQVIATMSRGQTLTIKATSGRGNEVTDRYSLTGFSQALDRARRECS
jgi:invasion associated locus B (IalB) protein